MIPADVKNLIELRDGGMCLRCGKPAHDIHRGMGGSKHEKINHPCNLVSLCRPCHSHIEANPDYSRANGWKLSGVDVDAPETVPVVGVHGVWWLLDIVDGVPVKVRI